MDKFYIDNSSLEVIAKCETAAVLGVQHELSSSAESEHLIAGNAAHEALAAWFKGATLNEALNLFALGYAELGSRPECTGRMRYENLLTILTDWFENNPVASFPLAPIVAGIEKPLAASLYIDHKADLEVIFVGLLDLPARKSNGQMVIVDHKTTGRVNDVWRHKFALGSQVDSYLWLANQVHSQENVEEMYINAIEFSDIPSSNRRCTLHGVPYSECGRLHPNHQLFGPLRRTPEQLLAWKETAIYLIQRYLRPQLIFAKLKNLDLARQEGRFNGSCQFCQFQKVCRQSRSLFAIEQYLTHRPWRSLLEAKVNPLLTASVVDGGINATGN